MGSSVRSLCVSRTLRSRARSFNMTLSLLNVARLAAPDGVLGYLEMRHAAPTVIQSRSRRSMDVEGLGPCAESLSAGQGLPSIAEQNLPTLGRESTVWMRQNIIHAAGVRPASN